MSTEVVNPQGIVSGERLNFTTYFTVDLNSEVPFDGQSFDNLTKLIITYPHDGNYTEKFICFRDVVYIFPYKIYHSDFYKEMKFNKKEVQCAGEIVVNGNGRTISGNSRSLMQRDLLSIDKSNEYKMGFLSDKLKDFFTIS